MGENIFFNKKKFPDDKKIYEKKNWWEKKIGE